MPRPITAPPQPSQHVTRSRVLSAAAADSDTVPHLSTDLSPPCHSSVLQDLNSGLFASPNSSSPAANDPASPDNCIAVDNDLLAGVDVENLSLSSDETWTPSIEGEDSDDDELDDDGSIWQETAIHFKDFSISFNKVDSDLEHGYVEEVKELKKRLLREFNTISRENSK